jgi:zinc transport system permease protein
MVNAFIIAILLALILPCIGIVVTFKRLSMIGDAFAHVSLSGVAIGLLLGVQPVLASVITCILAALAIEFIRNRLKKYAELSISIIMSLGIGLATVLSGFIRNA